MGKKGNKPRAHIEGHRIPVSTNLGDKLNVILSSQVQVPASPMPVTDATRADIKTALKVEGELNDDGTSANGANHDFIDEEGLNDFYSMFSDQAEGRSRLRKDPFVRAIDEPRITRDELLRKETLYLDKVDLHDYRSKFSRDWEFKVEAAVMDMIRSAKHSRDPDHKYIKLITGSGGPGSIRSYVLQLLDELLEAHDVLQYVDFRGGAFIVEVQ